MKIEHQFFKNIVTNYTGAAVSLFVPLIATSFYLKTLGASQYGLMAFIILIQSLINIFEAGLAQVLVKEFQLCKRYENNLRANQLLFEFEIIYVIFSLLVFLFLIIVSDKLVKKWLLMDVQDLNFSVNCLQISAFLVAFQMLGSLYRSALLSLDSHIMINTISSVIVILKHLIGIIISINSFSVLYLILWFTLISMIETLVKKIYTRKVFYNTVYKPNFNFHEIKLIMNLAGKMIIATLIGALAIQLDKIFLSNMLPINQLTYFSIASSLSLGFLQFVYPIHTSSLPLIIAAQGNETKLFQCNFKIVIILMFLFTGIWVFLILFGKSFISIWLKGTVDSSIIFEVLMLLMIGTTLNAFYGIGLNNLLVQGHTGSIAKLNASGFFCVLIGLPIFIKIWGLQGAASGWILFNLIGFIFVIVKYIDFNCIFFKLYNSFFKIRF